MTPTKRELSDRIQKFDAQLRAVTLLATANNAAARTIAAKLASDLTSILNALVESITGDQSAKAKGQGKPTTLEGLEHASSKSSSTQERDT